MARLDPRTRSFAYASAGHPTGYVLNARGEIKHTLPRTGVPLGIHPNTQYTSSAEIPLGAGDLMLVLTDGIEEAMSPDDALLGPERILGVVRAEMKKSAREIVEALYAAARQFAQNTPQLDDVTAIVLKVKPDA
jgi:serine phosphatase RsbU (regulator of sigma subunit)